MRLTKQSREARNAIIVEKLKKIDKKFLTMKEAAEITWLSVLAIRSLLNKWLVRYTTIYIQKTISVEDLIYYFKKKIWNK